MAVGAAVVGAVIAGAFSARAASQQQTFVGEKSDTAHQREVEDLRKAGLNPILSATSGLKGASTPPGAMAATPNFSAYMLMDAQREKIIAETANITARTNIMGPVEDVMEGFGAVTTPISEAFKQIVKKLPDLTDKKQRTTFFQEIKELLQNKPSDITGRKHYNLIQELWFQWRHRDTPSIH